jgi:aminomethyltransferase
MPLWYGGVFDEHVATREGAGLFDRSHLGRFYVTGERASEVLDAVLATDVSRIPVGRVQRAVACEVDGSVVELPVLCHLDEGRWLVVAGPRNGDHLVSHLEDAIGGRDVVVTDRMGMTALVELAGPRAFEVMSKVLGEPLAMSVESGGCRELLLGMHRAALARTSSVGEDGYWLLGNPEDIEALWRPFIEDGATSAGLAAHDALRLEAGVVEAPHETPRPATPFAAGLGDLVHFERADGTPRDFPGASALRSAAVPERVATGLRLEGPRLAKPGSRVRLDGRDIGACVSAAFSPALDAGIALAYLPPGLERVEVDTDGEWQPAKAVPLPFLGAR